ncbi:MAG: universal stress protein [Chromatiales bacterium]|nr:universal stress protein [Gammaproteobacteria bacterium]MBW6475724.1 universal stress protein [Chromatiales bacterium]
MNKVIAAIDGSRSSESVCDHAAWASLRLGAPLALLHVVRIPHGEKEADYSGNLVVGNRKQLLNEMVELEEQRNRLLREQGKLILADAFERVQGQGVADADRLLRHGRITETLNDLQDDARLVVLGKQGKDGDMVERHVGSHLESLIRTLKTPLLIAPLEYVQPQSFLIAYDGSASAEKVVDKVAQSPLFKGLSAHLLMVTEGGGAKQTKLDQARDKLTAQGFDVTSSIRNGEVTDVICHYANEHDIHLMAMGAFGHSVLRRFFVGSTTTRMIMQAQIPLLILR